jgi:hypothetical protein
MILIEQIPYEIFNIYEFDLLACPQCQEQMRIISTIEDQEVIEKILGLLVYGRTSNDPHPEPNPYNLGLTRRIPASFL